MLLTVEKVILLGYAPFLVELPGATLAEVAGYVEEVVCETGQVVCRQGETADAMYIVAAGAVELAEQGRATRRVEQNGVFGELAAMHPTQATATATALEDAVLLKLDRDALQEIIADHADVANSVIDYLCRRLEAAGA